MKKKPAHTFIYKIYFIMRLGKKMVRKIFCYLLGLSILVSGLEIIGGSSESPQEIQENNLSPDISAELFTIAQTSFSEQSSLDSLMQTLTIK